MKIGIKKTNKSNKTIIALIIGIIIVSIFIAVMIGDKPSTEEPEITTEPTTEVNETVDEIVIDENITESNADENTAVGEGEIIKLEEPEIVTQKPSSQKPKPQTSTVKPVEPVTQKPSPNSQGTHSEILENGNDSVKEYSCGSAKHHCDSKETHNFIVSLEQKGCPHCGSHSCKSFYAVDEWGNACYDPLKCEGYSEKNDASEYCQECGKKYGTGSNGTCVRFTVDTTCPECGKKVKGKTCHSH